MSIAEEIKSRLDIVSYIQQYAPLKKAGRSYKACCPFHNERTPSFVVNPDTQTWRCFGACAEGGDVFSFAMKRHGWNFREALEELGRSVGVTVQQQSPEQIAQIEQLDRLRGLLQSAAVAFHDCLLNPEVENSRAALHYVREKRGFTDETIQRFMIGYAPPGWQDLLSFLTGLGYKQDELVEVGLAVRSESGRVYDRFRGRLIIPIRDERGRVVGFGGRALSPEDNPKYLNSPQTVLFDKSRLLFGLDAAKESIRQSETAIIVEGYMDAIQAHQAGYANVVAQMGTALTESQLKLIVPRLASKVILALDSDVAGQNATRRSLEVARHSLQTDFTGKLAVDLRVLNIPGAKDPDDFLRESPDQWPTLVQQAVPLADFVIAMETAELGPAPTLIEREAVARRVLPLLLASENNLYKRDNVQKLALRLRIAESDLLAWAEEQRRIEAARPPAHYDEPPPPTPLADLEAPPDLDATGSVAPAAVQRRHSSPSRSIEAHCLRMLMQAPDFLFLVNRKLREISGGDETLRRGPLRELGFEDFSESDYRSLMQIYEDALHQDEMDPMDYMRSYLEEPLWTVLEELLFAEPGNIRQRVKNRLNGELETYWKFYESHSGARIEWDVEMIDRALSLRLQKLRRENQDLQFLQMQSQEEFTVEAAQGYGRHLNLSIRAMHLIHVELQRIRSPINKTGWFSQQP